MPSSRSGNLKRFLALVVVPVLLAGGCASSETTEDGKSLHRADFEPDLEALESRDPHVRLSAQRRFSALGPRVCRILGREVKARTGTGDAGPGFVCLLRLLGATGGGETWRPLCEAALKRALSPSVRIEAVRALATLGSPEGVDALVECSSDDEPTTLRLAAMAALTPFAGKKTACPALLRYMAMGAPSVRESAARALQDVEESSVREQFLSRLLDTHAGVRLIAVTYFLRYPHPGAATTLQILAVRDPDYRVALAAGKALAALDAPKKG
ncbi:MAG: HEAT repeat domain-containing protein [Planctomycetota bacterium]|jgi:HEAT repeat protein